MEYLKAYLDRIENRGNSKLAESILHTAEEVGNKYLKKFSFTSIETGLLLGNVQSGKTGQVFGIMSKAADLGFPLFLLLTTDNVTLQQQTLERVMADLNDFCICGENDSILFDSNSLEKPTIVVLKKNARILKLWANILQSSTVLQGNSLFIVDDEADAASLNTQVNSGTQSSINKNLDIIKESAASTLYLQVTGTPQALFLQAISSGWHPYFTYYFQPGEGYIGGDFFFLTTGKPDCIQYLDDMKTPTREVVLYHLMISAHIFATGGTVSNCIVHPSVRINVHKKYADEIMRELIWCAANLNGEVKEFLNKEYPKLKTSKSQPINIDSLLEMLKNILEKNVNVIVMNGRFHVDSKEYSKGCNFIIGGMTLGRGVTFPALQTIYYLRSSKKPQADTMWQHSRMFGYDRDAGLMKLFIDKRLYKLFADINATNNSIISQIEKGYEEIKVYYPEGLNPTRKNVIDNKCVHIISGGTNYYPYYPDNDSIEVISNLLQRFDDSQPTYQVSIRFIKELLNHIRSASDFKIESFQSILDSMLAETPAAQGILLVRRNRDITQGTGALISPNDWQIGRSHPNKTVLTMYQVTGTKGWGGKPLWVPNIKLPDGIIYYDILDE